MTPDPAPLVIAKKPRLHAHEVRGPGEAPSIEMTEALSDARAYAVEHGIRFEHQYLQGAVFDSSARQWVFDWQIPDVKGGITIVTVHESGQITTSGGE